MVKAYFAACEPFFPKQRGELRRIALALCRGGVDTMEQLCALQRAGPKGLAFHPLHRGKEPTADRGHLRPV